MNSEAEIIEEELVYGARRRELMWQRLGLTGMGFGMAGCLAAALVAFAVSCAFFEAPTIRQVCVELPSEDATDADRLMDNVGHLQMSLYGTRDAAMNWQEEVAQEMEKWGLKLGKYNPCTFHC